MMTFIPMLLALTAPAQASDTSGWIVMDLVDNATPDQVENIALTGDLKNVEVASPTSYDEALYIAYTTDVPASLEELRENYNVEAAEPRMEFHVLGTHVATYPDGFNTTSDGTTDPDYAKQWHMKASGSEWVWKKTSSGEGVVVAILDTGFTLTKDFNPEQVDVHGKSFTGEPLTDGHGHGTHCAASVAQWTDNGFAAAGLAKNATILPIKVLSNGGSGYVDWIAGGIDYATEQGADVISMSLGSSQESKVISRAIDRAIAAGVVVVAASGNDGGPFEGFPASYPPAISIGSMGPEGKRAFYSNYGKGLDLMATGGDKKYPGGGVFQWIKFQGKESLQEWQGTSMATPHAAAAVAILLSEGAEPQDVEMILTKTATPGPTKDGQYGKGIINIQAAVEWLEGDEGNSVIAGGTHQLPYPSPAGNLTMVIGTLAAGILLLLSRVYKFRPAFTTVALLTATLSSGPLYGLTYLPYEIPGLSVFMVHWLEIPDYLIGKGSSGFPLWMSFLPISIPFFVLNIFPKTRPIITGLLASTFAYLVVDTFTHCNPAWWMTSFGSSIWLGVNAMLVGAMLFMSTEFENTSSAHGGKL